MAAMSVVAFKILSEVRKASRRLQFLKKKRSFFLQDNVLFKGNCLFNNKS